MKKSVFMAGMAGAVLILTGLFTGCAEQKAGSGTEMADSADTDGEQEKTDQTERSDKAGREESALDRINKSISSKVRVLEDLGAESSLLSESFYLAGDIGSTCSVYIDPDEGEDFMASHRIQLFFSDARENASAEAELVLEPGKSSYEVVINRRVYADGVLKQETEEPALVTFITDGQAGTRIEIDRADVYGGTYYSAHNYEEIGLSGRFYTRTELAYLPSENLSLLRNTIYAHHGRKFKTESLNQYFQQKVWYRGRIEPEAFTDDMLTEAERANVRLIQELEGIPFDQRIKEGYGGPDGMEEAPCLPVLLKQRRGKGSSLTGNSVSGDTGISFDMTEAQDRGTYFEVPGVISCPVTVTQEQMGAVQAGGQAEITVDELTGETKLLEWKDHVLVLHEKGETEFDPGWNPYIGIDYDYEKGVYKLWQDSDDTIMKPVYRGVIRIAKGAVCGGHVSLLLASSRPVELGGSEADGEEGGNWILYDSRGTILAVYFLGD